MHTGKGDLAKIKIAQKESISKGFTKGGKCQKGEVLLRGS